MSPRFPDAGRVILSFPRVSGDEPSPAEALVTPELFSPRERG